MNQTVISGRLLSDAKVENESATEDKLTLRIGIMRYDKTDRKDKEQAASVIQYKKKGGFDKMLPYLKKDSFIGVVGYQNVRQAESQGRTISWVEFEATKLTFGQVDVTIISGRLLANAEVKRLDSGLPILNLRVAYSYWDRRKKKAVDKTVSCAMFGMKDVEKPFKMVDKLVKGAGIQVQGKINVEQYGTTEPKVKEVMMLDDYDLLTFLLPKEDKSEVATDAPASTMSEPDEDLPF